MKLDYKAQRPDGTTISQLVGLIATEEQTIRGLQYSTRQCEEVREEYIARLSQNERTQIVQDRPTLFPDELPSVHEVPYVYDPDFRPFPSATRTGIQEMLGDYVRKNIEEILNAVAPEARSPAERDAIKRALSAEANRMDPEGLD
jgi:hypothetical protein